MKVAWIGLGKMGRPMAERVLRAGHAVTVYNRSPEKAQALVEHGAGIADSPAAACRNVEALVTMVVDDEALRSVMGGAVDRGAFATLAPGALHLSMSTVGPLMAARARGQCRGTRFATHESGPCSGTFGRCCGLTRSP